MQDSFCVFGQVAFSRVCYPVVNGWPLRVVFSLTLPGGILC